MSSLKTIAHDFFEACETGKGWEKCKAYCHPNATFSAQSEVLGEVSSISEYAEWMKAIFTPMPDAHYEIKSFAVDEQRQNVCAYGVFKGTHTGEGGPVPATGKKIQSDYVYVMEFEGDKISHMTKIWHSGYALGQLGWG